MNATEKFTRFLADKGLRRTEPRDHVVAAFLQTERHLSTQELFDIVRKKHKDIGYATVARTLKLLTKCELCREVNFGDGLTKYEHNYDHEHHDHLVCTVCGKFVEIYSKRLEKIQDDMVAKHGYLQLSHRLQILGTCPKCQKKKKRK